MKRLRLVLGLAVVLSHLALGALIILLSFRFMSVAQREAWIRWWATVIVGLFGLDVRVEGNLALRDTGHMLVLNHISWVDIYVVDVYRATRFVARAEIRDWPLLGWLCDRTGTIFIERARRQAVLGAVTAVSGALQSGACVGLFPEGTTSDGRVLLPFHANLIQAAINVNAPIVPATLRYTTPAGRVATEAAYVGDLTLWDSIKELLRARPLRATLTLLPAISTEGMSRRDVTNAAREKIAAALGLQ